MNKIDKTQSGSILIEVTEAEFEIIKSGSITNDVT